MNEFEKLGISPGVMKAITLAGYDAPTPIQLKAIPLLLDKKDILATAQTGSGKTAAFAIPLLQHVHLAKKTESERAIKVLVLTPTRELANQVFESFKQYSRFLNVKNLVVFGGVSKRIQTSNLQKETDVLIATPGRLLDLMNDRVVDLSKVKHLVLDEADQMLDMGFINDVKKIISKTPQERQTLLFSATMPKEVDALAKSILHQSVRIEITPDTTTVDSVEDYIYFVGQKQKINLLIHLIKSKGYNQTLVFVRTKRNVEKVAKELRANDIKTEAIHSNKSQAARTRALSDFKAGRVEVLVATDIAARGIDIIALPFVYNFDLPELPTTYIHRIGRTGRAGLGGSAISFCDNGERHLLKDIEKHIGRKIEVIKGHPYEVEFKSETPIDPRDIVIAKANRNRKERVMSENSANSPHNKRPNNYPGKQHNGNRGPRKQNKPYNK